MDLDARLADDIARFVGDGPGRLLAGLLRLLLRGQLLLRDRARVAEHVRGELTVGVQALGALDDLDAGEIRRMLLDVGDRGAAHVGGDGVQALRPLVVILDVAAHRDVGHAEDVGEVTDQDGVVGKVAVGGDRQARAVRDQRLAVAIEDAPARGGRGDGSGLVLDGELLVVIRGDHLHAPQLGDDGGEDRARSGGKHGETALERRSLGVALPFRGARARAVLGVIGEFAAGAPQIQQRCDDHDEEDDSGDDDNDLRIHREVSLLQYLVARAAAGTRAGREPALGGPGSARHEKEHGNESVEHGRGDPVPEERPDQIGLHAHEKQAEPVEKVDGQDRDDGEAHRFTREAAEGAMRRGGYAEARDRQ